MSNIIGTNVKLYRDVVLRESTVGDDTVLADDCFITNSTIGKACTIERRNMVFSTNIGDYTYSNYNTVLKYATIGKFCSISWNCSIGGTNHDYERATIHPFPFKSKYGFSKDDEAFEGFSIPLRIGNDVWIGSNVCILRGVTIGDGAVIGAGSIVTKPIPAYSIAYGIPAKVHKYRFDEETIDKLLAIKWWDWEKERIVKALPLFRQKLDQATLEQLLTIYHHN